MAMLSMTPPGMATLSRRISKLTPPAPPAPPPTRPPTALAGMTPGTPLFTAPPPPVFGEGAPGISGTTAPGAPNIGALMTPPPFPSAPPPVSGMSGSAMESALTKPGGLMGGITGGSVLGRLGGEYSVLDQYDAAFQKASSHFGLPANVLKAIAAIERGWEGSGISPSGAVGIMQVMPQYWGNKGFDIYSTEGNIMAGALAYKSFYDQYKDEAARRGMNPYEAAARAYLAGNPWSGASDYYGTTTSIYGQRFNDFLGQLGGSAGTSTGTPTGGGDWTQSWQAMFGTTTAGDYGYNAPNNLGYYTYGNQYGMDGNGHTGIDQPMPVGTPYRAPMGGVVTCAGTGRGPGADGGGCAKFNDYFGQGAGRVEVQLDNGVVLIFGHSSTSALQPGARFNAGQVLGTSGGMNGPHIHLEARVRDSGTPSGWRIVDPRTVIGGGGMAGSALGQAVTGGYRSGSQGVGSGPGGLMTLRDLMGWT